mgnify:CR=1 FL=1
MKRTKSLCRLSLLVIILITNTAVLFGQAYTGNTLYGSNNSKYTYLRDMSNTLIHTWTSTRNGGYSCYMTPDGSIYRPAVYGSSLNGGAAAGMVQKLSWSGAVLWEYAYSTSTYRSHHDICPMPNGNVLLIAWETKTSAQCVAAGLNHSSSLWPDHIIEVQPVGTSGGIIVWQWHFWDHLIQDYDATKSNYGVVANHPELLDINVGSTSGDWMHCNGISYNAARDEIVISSHNLDEIYVIDHSTTTAEAAGHTGGARGKGGDFLYRWGRASNYRVASSPQVFNVVHCSKWITDGLPGTGNILAFNNREGTNSSMIVEITPPIDSLGNYTLTPGTAYLPSAPTWSYSASGFYSNHLGGVQRLPNGNTLIAESTSGYLFEVNQAGTVQWSYQASGEIVRALRYPPNYITSIPDEEIAKTPVRFELFQNYPNPFNPSTTIEFNLLKNGFTDLTVFDVTGKEVAKILSGEMKSGVHKVNFNSDGLTSGVYFYKLTTKDFSETKRMMLLK